MKTYYCDNFAEVVEGCPVPVIIAGGKKLSQESEALRLAYDALQDGASGVDMGRNIWQSSHPVSMIKAVRSIVHGNANEQEAYEEFLKGSQIETPKEDTIESK